VFYTAYINNILIYSNNLEEHYKYINKVLKLLKEADLYLNIKKCKFEVKEVTYLGLIIGKEGVCMDPAKVKCIIDWKEPKNIKDI